MEKWKLCSYLCFISECDVGSKVESVQLNGVARKSSMVELSGWATTAAGRPAFCSAGWCLYPNTAFMESLQYYFPLPNICERLPKEKMMVPRQMYSLSPNKKWLIQLPLSHQRWTAMNSWPCTMLTVLPLFMQHLNIMATCM